MYALISVIKNPTKKIINTSFIDVNKSIPVPESYFDKDKDKKELCEKLVSYICNTYPNFISTSYRPIRPNFNQDSLNDDIYKAIIVNEKITYKNAIDNLVILNKEMKKNIIQNGITHWKKSFKSDFWLFYMTREEFIDRLKKIS
jgi:hypothetical protein